MSKGLASLSAALEAKPVKEIKEPVTKQDRFEMLKHISEALNKQFETTNSLQVLGKKVGQPFPSISTGLLSLDHYVLGCGGIPKGRIIEVYGPECLSGESYIQYEIKKKDGSRVNHKGGTLQRLYERFNDICEDGRANKVSREELEFFAPSTNEEGRIVQNKIEDVVYAGIKDCYTIYTKSGLSITASKDHKFKTNSGWKTLEGLKTGDSVFIHNSTPFKVGEYTKKYLKSFTVKHHGVAYKKSQLDKKTGNTYEYHILRTSRAIVEAHANLLSLEDYLNKLNSGDIKDLYFLPSNLHVHHIDENTDNDDISNLKIISSEEHGRLHAIERHNNLRYINVEDEIVDIMYSGTIETYDVSMHLPYNNFVADGFVVHNSSGKTTITLQIIAEEQKQSDNLVAFIDAEHALDPNYAKKLGVNVDELIISQPDSGEQALETAIALVEGKVVSLIVIDSVAALVPQAELDGEMGDSHMGLQARLMSQAMRKLRGICAINGVSIIFINQIREKVGVIYGSPEVTTGGRALKFYSSVRLDIRRKSGETGLIGTKEHPLGHVIKVKATKNKMASPFHEAEIDLVYGVGIDKSADFVRYAESLGVIEKAGAWYKYKGENIGQGLTNTASYVSLNPELIEKIKIDIEALRKV